MQTACLRFPLFFSVLLCLATAVLPRPAVAVPVLFHFEGTIASSSIPGVVAGNTVLLDVVMDNGGNVLENQVWNNNSGHFISANLSVGSYSADYGTSVTLALFTTNAAGNLVSGQTAFREEGGVNQDDNVDSFGFGSPISFFLGIQILTSQSQSALIASPFTTSPDPWTFDFTTVDSIDMPEPATVALFSVGLTALGLTGRRHRWRQKRSNSRP